MAAPNPTCPSFKKWRGISMRAHQRSLEEAKPPVFAPKFNVYVPGELQDLLKTRPKEFSPDDLTTAVTAIKASDKVQWLPAVKAVRKALSKEKSPPIQEAVDLGVLPRLVAMMAMTDSPELQLEAAWAVCNVASGTSAQCCAAVEAGAIAPAMALLSSDDPLLREQAAWLLGNIAGDGAVLRDVCLDAGLLPPLLAATRKETEVKPLRQMTWLLLNMTRFKPRKKTILLSILPALAQLVSGSTDGEVLADGLSALAHVADDCKAEVVTEAKHVVALAARILNEKVDNKDMALPAAKVLSSLCAGSDSSTQAVVDTGVLTAGYRRFLEAEQPAESVLREVCFALSNIAAGTKAQAQALQDAGLLPPLTRVFRSCGNSTVHREAVWALANMSLKGLPGVATALLDAGAAPVLAETVERNAPKQDRADVGVTTAAAEALYAIAQAGNAVAAYGQDGVYDTLQRAVDGGLKSKALQHVQKLLEEFPPA